MSSRDEAVVFDAVLFPSRSLGRRGFLIFMSCFCAFSLMYGLMFYALGAWPVAGFLGLDVIVLWLAFHFNFLHARERDYVWMSGAELRIRQVSSDGTVQEYHFNPRWVRLSREMCGEFGVTRLMLSQGPLRVVIGKFLSPEDKSSFHDAFSRALHLARG